MTGADQPTLSVVSPVYRAEGIVDELIKRLIVDLEGLGVSYEIILVDDRSPDGSWARIVANSEHNGGVRAVRLSRNFGQHSAIAAGLAASRGDYVVVMDCDLQDNPNYIGALLAEAKRGHDIVYTRTADRRHSPLRNAAARAYFAILGTMGTRELAGAHLSTSAYSLISRRVVDEYLRIEDAHSHYLLNLQQLGFSSSMIEVVHDSRFEGDSSYTLGKLLRHAANGLTSSSPRLLNLSIGVGLGFVLVSIVGVAYLVIGYLVRGALAGYTSLMVIMLLSTGVILMSIGITGLYIGRIFEQVKRRPHYIVDETLNLGERDL